MAKSGPRRTKLSRSLSRRSLLLVPGLSVLASVACGDESSERHFAGDPRTSEAIEETNTQEATPFVPGSPTVVPTAMATRDLLSPRGQEQIGIVPLRHGLIVIVTDPGEGRSIWRNDERALWAAAADPTSARVATLTSASEAAADWAVEFIPVQGGDAIRISIGRDDGKDPAPDAAAEGRGGIAWLPDSGSVAVSMPTGGLLQVFPDGSQIRLAKAARVKRPAAVALSPHGDAIAFVEQPSGSDGSGIYAGSMRAKPIDPVIVLPPDRSGNRFAREVQWVGASNRLATIIEREELGSPQGDLFILDTQSGAQRLAWTSPAGRETASVESFVISSDGLVTAFVTNPVRARTGKTSSVWVMQTDGPSIERFDLPTILADPRLAFTSSGLIATGVTGTADDREGSAAGFLLASNGQIDLIYQQEPAATPVASPAGSAVAFPRSSPIASPASPAPAAVTDGD